MLAGWSVYSPFCQIVQGDFNVLSMTKLLAMSLKIKHNPHHSLGFQWQESARKLQEVKPFTFWGVPSFKVHPFWGGLGNQKMLDTQTTWKILENNENSRFLQTNLTILGRIQDGGIQWLSPRRETRSFSSFPSHFQRRRTSTTWCTRRCRVG